MHGGDWRADRTQPQSSANLGSDDGIADDAAPDRCRPQFTVWNRSRTSRRAGRAGATAAAHPREVADAASIIFMCLTDAAAVEEVAGSQRRPGRRGGVAKLVVDFSSIPRTRHVRSPRAEAANGMAWIDAPVSGGTKGAEEGTLA